MSSQEALKSSASTFFRVTATLHHRSAVVTTVHFALSYGSVVPDC